MFCSSSITNSANKSNPLQIEFHKKSEILECNYPATAPLQFYNCIFHENLDREFLYVCEETGKYKIAAGYDELLEIAQFRSDVYIPMADFFNNCYKIKTLKTIYALIIDLDNMTPKDLKGFLWGKLRRQPIQPTLILNSGSGLHLYYVLRQPVECYSKPKAALIEIYNKLQDQFFHGKSFDYKMDRHHVIQPYRVHGTLTKLGEMTRGFTSGPKVSVEELANWLGVEWEDDLTRSFRQQQIKKTTAPAPKVKYMPNGKAGFYNHICYRILDEVPEGNRYMAMFALAVVAWKCRVSREQLEDDLHHVVDFFCDRDPQPVKESEIRKAMTGYGPDATMVSSTKLEEWLGFNFYRKSKRNGRSREEHLERARAARNAVMAIDKKSMIQKYLKYNPEASQAQIARALHMSRDTVRKYTK